LRFVCAANDDNGVIAVITTVIVHDNDYIWYYNHVWTVRTL